MLVFSVHGDTNFKNHQLHMLNSNDMKGHLDNFAGVYCIMRAFFSGKLNKDYVRIEITYGEEVDFAGAKEVRNTLQENDLVIVIDVTGTPVTHQGFVIEKCFNSKLYNFLQQIFASVPHDLYRNCPDQVCSEDETDVYRKKCAYCCFLGVPTTGGDYNEGQVQSTMQHLDAVVQAIITLVERYPEFVSKHNLDKNMTPKSVPVDMDGVGDLF